MGEWVSGTFDAAGGQLSFCVFVIDASLPGLEVLVSAWDAVEAPIFSQLRSGLVKPESNIRCDTLLSECEHPVVIADPGSRARFAACGDLFDCR